MTNRNCKILLEYLRNILYGSGDKEMDLQTLDEPFRELGHEMQVLPALVERLREQERQLQQKEEKANKEKEKLTSKAYLDTLTGIPNRLYFEEKMGQFMEECRHFTFCYADLDGLKGVNDRFGHRVGDAYICEFVSRIRARIREYDVFTRIGGDEFCLVFPECHMEVADQKMKKVLEEFAEYGAPQFQGSFSYGLIEIAAGDEPRTLDEILAEADEKMYRMKRKHKEQT